MQRSEVDLAELIETAKGICGNKQELLNCLGDLFEPAAQAYLELCANLLENKKEFFGLRDFYAFIKLLVYFAEETNYKRLTKRDIKYAVMRNFAGFDAKQNIEPLEIFMLYLGNKLSIDGRDAIPKDFSTPIGM